MLVEGRLWPCQWLQLTPPHLHGLCSVLDMLIPSHGQHALEALRGSSAPLSFLVCTHAAGGMTIPPACRADASGTVAIMLPRSCLVVLEVASTGWLNVLVTV